VSIVTEATLYHHGRPQRRQLMTGDGREWLVAQLERLGQTVTLQEAA
jgi:hypothetical protein